MAPSALSPVCRPEDLKQTVLTDKDESIDYALDELAELTPRQSASPAVPSPTELRSLHPQVLTIPLPGTDTGAGKSETAGLSSYGWSFQNPMRADI